MSLAREEPEFPCSVILAGNISVSLNIHVFSTSDSDSTREQKKDKPGLDVLPVFLYWLRNGGRTMTCAKPRLTVVLDTVGYALFMGCVYAGLWIGWAIQS
jgi:hypothetical protein